MVFSLLFHVLHFISQTVIHLPGCDSSGTCADRCLLFTITLISLLVSRSIICQLAPRSSKPSLFSKLFAGPAVVQCCSEAASNATRTGDSTMPAQQSLQHNWQGWHEATCPRTTGTGTALHALQLHASSLPFVSRTEDIKDEEFI